MSQALSLGLHEIQGALMAPAQCPLSMLKPTSLQFVNDTISFSTFFHCIVLKPQCVMFRPCYIFTTQKYNAGYELLYVSHTIGFNPLTLAYQCLQVLSIIPWHNPYAMVCCFIKIKNWFLNQVINLPRTIKYMLILLMK